MFSQLCITHDALAPVWAEAFLVLSLKRCCLLQTMTLGNYTSLLNLSDVIIYPNGTLQV